MKTNTIQTNNVKPEVISFNRQVNYVIIENLWEYLKKDIHKEAIDIGLYAKLGLNKNSYSKIRTKEPFNLKRKWEKLKELGVEKEYMLGEKMIEIEGISQKDWENYFYYRYEYELEVNNTEKRGLTEEEKKNKFGELKKMKGKLEQSFRKLRPSKKDESAIGKLYYYFYYDKVDIPDEEMHCLYDSLKDINVDKIKKCDKELRRMIYKEIEEKSKWLRTIIEYDDLSK